MQHKESNSMITKAITNKNGSSGDVRTGPTPQFAPLDSVLPRVSPIDDLTSITNALNRVDRRCEIVSLVVLVILSASFIFACLNYASGLQF